MAYAAVAMLQYTYWQRANNTNPVGNDLAKIIGVTKIEREIKAHLILTN